MAKSNEFRSTSTQTRGGDFENGRHWETYEDENEWREAATRIREKAAGPLQIVQRNPFSAVMTAFGLGLGFGLAVTLLVTRREPSWYERNISEPLQNLPERLRHVPDSLGSYVPASWKHR